jgi:hypothetical protein
MMSSRSFSDSHTFRAVRPAFRRLISVLNWVDFGTVTALRRQSTEMAQFRLTRGSSLPSSTCEPDTPSPFRRAMKGMLMVLPASF